jgi:mRNA-degrading endonuclease toxin of MazEF toxin-antitoxin module
MSFDEYNRYDVYLAKLPKAKGSVQQGIRPVVIWNGSEYDYLMDKDRVVLTGFCLTTEKKPNLPVHCLLKASESCLKQDSTFLAEQPVRLLESDLIERWGNLSSKEHRYMIYRAISIQTSKDGKPYGMFKYPYKFLVESKKIAEFLMAVWHLLKFSEALRKPELRAEMEKCYELEMVKLRAISKKYDVVTSHYITDLSEKNIYFSLLDL